MTDLRAYFAAYYAEHRDKALAYQAAYRAAHPGQQLAYDLSHRDQKRAYDATRREKRRAHDAAHPDERRVRWQAYRARKMGNGGSHTAQEWLDKCALLGNCCIYCGEAKPLEADHNVPLARGGADDITNILPACRSCNARKGTKTAKEFLALRRTA